MITWIQENPGHAIALFGMVFYAISYSRSTHREDKLRHRIVELQEQRAELLVELHRTKAKVRQ